MLEAWQAQLTDREELGVYDFYFLSTISIPPLRERSVIRYLCVVWQIFQDFFIFDIWLLIFAILSFLVAGV